MERTKVGRGIRRITSLLLALALLVGCSAAAPAVKLTAAQCASLDAEWQTHKQAFDLAQSLVERLFPDMDEYDTAMESAERASDGMQTTLDAQDAGGCFD